MKTTADFLNELQAHYGVDSDNALGLKLGMHRQQVNMYRKFKAAFDDEMCLRVAEILSTDPAYIMACMHHQRAKNPKVKAVWEWTAQHLGGIAAALAVLAIIPFTPDIMSAPSFMPEGANGLGFAGFTQGAGIYIMRISG